MIKNIQDYGDQSIIIDFGDEIKKEINQNVIFYFKKIKEIIDHEKIEGVENIIPSYNKLVVQFDLLKIDHAQIKNIISQVKIEKLNNTSQAKIIEVPVNYDLEFGIDLERLSELTKLTIDEIINTHLQTDFYVYMLGFMPGFPYMGDLDSKVYSKRLETPRVEIPQGSVIMVEQFCAIYPYKSPGGWNIIGRTPVKLFDQNKNNSSLINPGDTVKFKKISKEDFHEQWKKNYEL